MNILHVIRDLEASTGGPVAATIAIALMQKKEGNNVTILTVTRKEVPIQPLEGIEVIEVESSFWKWRYSRQFYSIALREIQKADVVHVHTVWEYTSYIVSKLCEAVGKPFILRPCGMLDKWSMQQGGFVKQLYYNFIAKGIIARAAYLNFASLGEQELSKPYIAGAASFVLPNPVNTVFQELQPLQNTEKETIPVILFVGRLHPHKQIELIIDALGQLCAQEYCFKFQIAGDGEKNYKTSLMERVGEAGIESKVQWLGAVNADKLKSLYRHAYCLVLPSMHENFGNVLSEAMSQACPVIVSKGVHIHKDVEQAHCGYVVNDDSNSLLIAIKRLLDNQDEQQIMSDNARKQAKENYFADQVNRKLTSHYLDAIKRFH